jgi:hypothetical protein
VIIAVILLFLYVLVFLSFSGLERPRIRDCAKIDRVDGESVFGYHEWLFANVKNVGIMNKSAYGVVIHLGGDVQLQ